MKQKKHFKYHLKKDVRSDLFNLVDKINYFLRHDDEGFYSIPSCTIYPSLFKVFVHLLWNRTFETWFKKVYE